MWSRNDRCMWAVPETLSGIVWGFKCGGRTYLTKQTTVSLCEKNKVLHRHIQLRRPPWRCMYAEIKRLVWQVIINSQSEFSSLELNNASITKQTASLHKLQSRKTLWTLIYSKPDGWIMSFKWLYSLPRWCLRSTCLLQLHLTRLHWIVL